MIELIGAAVGGLFRLAPEIVKLRDAQLERTHELLRLDKQLEFQKLSGSQKIEESRLAADSALDVSSMAALGDALRSQLAVTGNATIDFITMTVRPFVTYLFVALYLLSKIGLMAVALDNGVDPWAAIVSLYDNQDRGMLAGIMSFWFLGRVFDKRNHE